MKLNLSTRLLAGALVLAASGSVFANTNIADGQTGNSSMFLDVVDLTAGTDYVLDLSTVNASNHYSSFNAAAAQTISLAGDANWTAFKATTGSDEVQYNVVAFNTIKGDPANGGLITSAAPTGTSQGSVGGTTNSQIRNNSIDPYIALVNSSATASTSSLFVTTSGPNANPDAYFGTKFQLASGWPSTLADVGTAQTFYRLTAGSNLLAKASVTTYGTWNLIGDTLSYGPPIPTPLPMPVTLLLSGLALMGIISRRGKSGTDVSFSGAAA
jgi:hypothetical protein